jgi:hypothetical protein
MIGASFPKARKNMHLFSWLFSGSAMFLERKMMAASGNCQPAKKAQKKFFH